MEMFETAAQFLAFVVVVGILIAGVAVMLINIIKSVCKKNAIIDDSIFEKVSERVNNSLYYILLILLLFVVLGVLVDVVCIFIDYLTMELGVKFEFTEPLLAQTGIESTLQ